MRKSFCLFLVLITCVLTTPIAIAQAPITFLPRDDMDFGNVLVIINRTDFLEMDTDGNVVSTRGRTVINGITTAARFRVDGEPNTQVTITIGNRRGRAFLNGPGQNIRIDNFITNRGTTTTFNNNGRFQLRIGGRMRIRQNQAAGAYAGTYNVTVDY